MPGIGILCDQDRKREEMIQIVEMLAAKEGFDCIIYALGREADGGCGDTAVSYTHLTLPTSLIV